MSESNSGSSGANEGNGSSAYDPYDALEFPCRFEVKVMGKPSNRFSAIVGSVFTRHLRYPEDLLQVVEKYSSQRRYVSQTYIIMARGKDQLRAIYLELSRCEAVLMTL